VPDLAYLILGGLTVCTLGFFLLDRTQPFSSPVRSIFGRWLRWLMFTFVAAALSRDLELIDRPYWALVPGFFLLWLLAETLYNWLAISALSLSPLPLFPRFAVNDSGDEWPMNMRFLRLRDWLRAQGFKPRQAIQAEVRPGLKLRGSFYQDATGTLRLQILFLPQPGGTLTVCYALTTRTASDRRYLTDNLCLPFGGFYPENWLVDRSPWRRSLARLLARHRARLARAGEIAVPWTDDPLTDVNAQQKELEQLNTELGFLVPPAQRDERGKITQAGRYRVWKEYWLLQYFGRSARYE